MTEQSTEEAVAEIWRLFRETDAQFKETAVRFKETDAKFKETDAKFKETDAKFKETDAKFKETDARLDQRIRQLEGLFGNQWGRLVEALVEPGVLRLFQERGIPVHHLYRRALAQQNGDHMEVDLLLENVAEVVDVEVKSALSVDDINEFLAELGTFTHFFPKYKDYRIYGAVAGLNIDRDVARYAYRRGLFVISITGNNLVHILNDEKFKPRNFGAALGTTTAPN